MSTSTSPDLDLRGHPEVSLVDLLDRLLAAGAVVAGDLTLSIADVDLVRIELRLLIGSVSALTPLAGGEPR
ncbi:gas vesicle protein [Streptomyces sp. NPDC049577]|uniref:gas vesicle protein n=1 Tax=Streptomyces sp. NPDC049577 TaxID=3155153 RepID=UPI00342B12E1